MPAAAVEERDNRVFFSIEVSVPFRQAPMVAAALTGNDDDIVLAAEKAMRERIEEAVEEDAEAVREKEGLGTRTIYDLDERIELAVEYERDVKPFLADVMGGQS